ncbi:MAG: DUF2798 domain-containing protein [Pseudomonadota bacterium]
MKPFIPARLEPIIFGLLLSGMMSFIVSGVATALALRAVDMGAWISAWLSSWLIAFPAVLIVAPLVRRILQGLVKQN